LLTLNQIHAQIVALANAHYQIAEVGMGTIAELQGKPDRLYPLLWLSNEGGSLEDNYKVDNIRLTMFGRVIVGEEGQDDDASEIEVLSDMQLILLDFLNYFHQQHGQEYVTDKAATLEHFTERTNDRTAGYSCVLELKQFYDWNKCNIPQSGAVIPPTIDGLTLYDFCDQSVLDRLTAEQNACLLLEFGNCADATVENSDASYSTTVASGATLVLPNIDFTDSDGTTTSVPSVQNIVATPIPPCADATVQLNGTTVGTVASGATGDFPVNLDGSPSGVWDGTAWQVTSTPCADATVELNGVEMTTIPSGDTENISIRQSSGATEVGSKQGVHWRIDDSAISINGSPVADVKAEDSLDIDVTQDGSPVGSWNGSAWIVPPCADTTLTIGVFSDAGHTTPITETDIGVTAYILATPTGSTPDNYLFFSYDGTLIKKIGEQAGGSISWTPTTSLTNGSIYAVASDSVGGDKSWNNVDFDVNGDPDALAFILAAGITDSTQILAIDELVNQLKAYSIWSKFKAIYPFVGGTAFSHKFNLKNPLDTDAAYRLAFSGGGTHGVNGYLPNGTNAYANTFLIPSVALVNADWHLSYYSRTNVAAGTDFDMGCGNSFGQYTSSMFLRRSDNSIGFDSGNASSANRISSTETDSTGLYVGSIRSTSDRTFRKNGTTVIGSDTSTLTNVLLDSSLLLAAYNQRAFGSPGLSPNFYGSKQLAFSSIGDGLTNTDISNLYTAVQAFQTTLGRNV
jgi:hypothetical protein